MNRFVDMSQVKIEGCPMHAWKIYKSVAYTKKRS